MLYDENVESEKKRCHCHASKFQGRKKIEMAHY
jgi:hypothetical protein